MKLEVEVNEDIIRKKTEKEVEKTVVSEIIERISRELTVELKDVLHVMIRRECEKIIGPKIEKYVEIYVGNNYFWRFRESLERVVNQDSILQTKLFEEYREQVSKLFESIKEEDKQNFLLQEVANQIAHRYSIDSKKRDQLANIIIELSGKDKEE